MHLRFVRPAGQRGPGEEIAAIAERLDLSAARRLVEGMETAMLRLERNVNPKLLAEVLLLDLPKLGEA